MNRRPPKDARVLVRQCSVHGDDEIVQLGGAGIPGAIYRPRRADEGAWVRLDVRSALADVHPFPADDDRGRDVLAYPEDYEVLHAG
jgi:hypothetical protein